jgi:hypothetical protein
VLSSKLTNNQDAKAQHAFNNDVQLDVGSQANEVL